MGFQPRVPRVRYRRTEACAQVKCAYCGRYGALGTCAGCGAPLQTAMPREAPHGWIEITAAGDSTRRFMKG